MKDEREAAMVVKHVAISAAFKSDGTFWYKKETDHITGYDAAAERLVRCGYATRDADRTIREGTYAWTRRAIRLTERGWAALAGLDEAIGMTNFVMSLPYDPSGSTVAARLARETRARYGDPAPHYCY